MKKDMRVYLAHILECIEKIERFTRGGKEEFLQEALIQDAVIRNLEVIGEASKRVDNSYRTSHPQIPWRKMTACEMFLFTIMRGWILTRCGSLSPMI
jgi:uncharacterized protein with HEPN domain